MSIWPPKKNPVDKDKAIKTYHALRSTVEQALRCRFESRHQRALHAVVRTMPTLREALNQTLPPVDLDELLTVAGAPHAGDAPLERLKKAVALVTSESAAGVKLNARIKANDFGHYICPQSSALSDFTSTPTRGRSWAYSGEKSNRLAAFLTRAEGYEKRIREGLQISEIYQILDDAGIPQHRDGDLFKRIIMVGDAARQVAENNATPPKADRRRPALTM